MFTCLTTIYWRKTVPLLKYFCIFTKNRMLTFRWYLQNALEFCHQMYCAGELASGKVGHIVSKVNTLKLVGLLTSSVRMKLYLRMFGERKDSLDGYLCNYFHKSNSLSDLVQLMRIILSLSHGQASLKRKFSIDKELIEGKQRAICCCSNICQRSHTISKWPKYWIYPPEIQLSRSLEALFALFPELAKHAFTLAFRVWTVSHLFQSQLQLFVCPDNKQT